MRTATELRNQPSRPHSRDLSETLLARLEAERRNASPSDLVTASVELPWRVPQMPRHATAAWIRGRDSTCFCAGEAAVIQSNGEDRFGSVRARAEALWARVVGTDKPRVMGGFAFDDRDLEATPWRDFSSARFVLPRFQLLTEGDTSRLVVCVRADAEPSELRSELGSWLGAPVAPSPLASDAAAGTPLADDRSDYRGRVAEIVRTIAEGHLKKVVAARSSEVLLTAPLDPARVITRLTTLYPECYGVVIASGQSHLIGAPPELLVHVNGLEVRSEALAGSVARSAPAAAETLLASTKDRSEQELVVNAIEGVLGPLCTALDVPETPRIRELRHLLHLRSEIHGTLSAKTHVVDLVERLHPTPAVGGTPTSAALAWIREHEPEPRGWYAAPVGWFDAEGNGEFAVAIRSALVRDRRAYVYAGAGIVRASDADSELAETVLKQRAMLEALGVGM